MTMWRGDEYQNTFDTEWYPAETAAEFAAAMHEILMSMTPDAYQVSQLSATKLMTAEWGSNEQA